MRNLIHFTAESVTDGIEMNFHDYFEYRDGEIYWKSRPAYCCRIGDIAGGVNSKGYRRVHIKREYAVHRVIWEMHHGKIPRGFQIDHIDRNPLNNRIENLRLASLGQNRANIKKLNHKNASPFISKFKGVRRTPFNCFKVTVKQKYIGSFKCEKEAAMAYDREAEKVFGSYSLKNKDLYPDDLK
jgi:hypothetical protein